VVTPYRANSKARRALRGVLSSSKTTSLFSVIGRQYGTGCDRVTFEVADLAKQPNASYDVVSTFDVIHDMADPRSLRRVVKDDDIFVLMEVVWEEDPADNADPMAVVKLGASIHFCMTTSLARAAWVWVPSVCRKARSRNLPGKLVSPPCADCRSNIPSTYSTKSAPDFEVFS